MVDNINLDYIKQFDFTLNDKWREGFSWMGSGHDDDQPFVVGNVPVEVVRDRHHWKLSVLLNMDQEIMFVELM